jgi:membrane-bound inhibitor of C-type lysozyme
MISHQPNQQQFMIAAPFCAKCKRQVHAVQIMHDPMRQVHHLTYQCHGESGTVSLSQVDLVNMTQHNTLIDFVEFSKVADNDNADDLRAGTGVCPD